jgi:hypothetical protein
MTGLLNIVAAILSLIGSLGGILKSLLTLGVF